MVVLLLLCAGALAQRSELLDYDPKADPAAITVSKNARFTVLTPSIIRMEYSSKGQFEDRATIAFVNRKLPVPTFTVDRAAGFLMINTSVLALRYQIDQPFSGTSLTITSKSPSTFKNWRYGQADSGNLFGTIRTLDGTDVVSLNCTEYKKADTNCEFGLISRDGWVVVDDSKNYALDNTDYWVGPNTDDLDLYFFGHGRNYVKALSEYTQIGGKVAMFPRYANGIMWSRWYDISNADTMKIVEDYDSRHLPLDVYILDMNWHTKNSWTGYTFDTHLFPFPADTLSWLHHKGLRSSANLHDAEGVNTWEKQHSAMAASLGLDPSKKIDFNLVNRSYAYALEDVVLQDLEKMGMDFWWIDWQQGEHGGGCAGGKQNPTIWTNKLRTTDHIRRKENVRGLVLARWGGLGNHRYQVGFSGDVARVNWADFAFQPYFSLTASNVGFGFWSHDIVGTPEDHELHTRWIQFAAFSGTFRTHDRGGSAGGCADTTPDTCWIVELWNVPTKYFEANRDAVIAREELIPYIYTHGTRSAFVSGVGILRPMYYDWPEQDAAYYANKDGDFAQYMFGPELLVAPVVAAADAGTQMAKKTVWLPPGVWFEYGTGILRNITDPKGFFYTKYYDLREIPVFVKAGAIITTIPVRGRGSVLGLAAQQYKSLVFTVIPGASTGSNYVYEDDGYTNNYLQGAYAETTASYQRTADTLKFTVSTTGTYPELPSQRTYTVRLLNFLPPKSVTVAGKQLPYSRFGGDNTWTYDGAELAVIITVTGNTKEGLALDISTSNTNVNFAGAKGAIKHGLWSKNNLNEDRKVRGEEKVEGGKLQTLSSTGEALSYLAGQNLDAFVQVVNGLPSLLKEASDEVKTLIPPAEGALVQLWDEDRKDNCLCGTEACLDANSYYATVRVEGFQPKSTESGVVPLRDYWNGVNDNWASTVPDAPSGYRPADFSNGYVLAQSKAGTAVLSLWYNDDRHDALTVATQAGLDYAKANNYRLLNGTLGYVYTSSFVQGVRTRVAYSLALLENVYL